jgi:DNA-binding MarR family transcriptional regulator
MAADQTDELRRLTQRFFRRFGALAADVTPCGKPMPVAHAHALMVLLARGELSQQELGEELGIDKSNVARLCAKMVEARQASQRTSKRDARSRRISLTARGERLAKEVDAASRARFHGLLEALPEDRRDPVIEALRHLVTALDRMDTRAPVPLLPMMANHQKQNMRDHLVAVQEIVAALAPTHAAPR